MKNKNKIQLADSIIKLGLSPACGKIYQLLFISGARTATEIGKDLNINRTTVYEYLKDLKQKSLISEKEINNKKYFVAEDIDLVIRQLKLKHEDIKIFTDELIKNKNNLKIIEKSENTKIKFYESKQGLESALDSILYNNEKEILSLWPHNYMLNNYNEKYLEDFNDKRILKNKTLKVIWTSNTKSSKDKHGYPIHIWKSDKGVERKILDKLNSNLNIKNINKASKIDINDINMGYAICGDKVAFISGSSDIYSFVITSGDFSTLLRMHFYSLWNILK